MGSIRRTAALLLLLFFALATHGEEARVEVTLSHAGTDAVGKRLASTFRNELAASRKLSLVNQSRERIGIYLVTMAGGGGTIYSVTWTLGGMTDDGYLTSKVGVCAGTAVRACARSLLVDTDQHASVLYGIQHQKAVLGTK